MMIKCNERDWGTEGITANGKVWDYNFCLDKSLQASWQLHVSNKSLVPIADCYMYGLKTPTMWSLMKTKKTISTKVTKVPVKGGVRVCTHWNESLEDVGPRHRGVIWLKWNRLDQRCSCKIQTALSGSFTQSNTCIIWLVVAFRIRLYALELPLSV